MVVLLFGFVGAILGLYVGGWLMFVQPIMDCLNAFDAGLLTATILGFAILKCVFASFVGYLIFYMVTLIGALIEASL